MNKISMRCRLLSILLATAFCGISSYAVAQVELTAGTSVENLSGAQNSQQEFSLEVPAGATGLSFNISGGTGDADLYVKFGSAPTLSSYDCRPYLNGNSETCSITNIQAGTYYVMLRAYFEYSGASLLGTYTTATSVSFSRADGEIVSSAGLPIGINSGTASDEATANRFCQDKGHEGARDFTYSEPMGATYSLLTTDGNWSATGSYNVRLMDYVTCGAISGFTCSAWDGSVPQVGSYIRLKNIVAKDVSIGPANYRTDIAGKYLVNALHGSEPVPKFVGTDADSLAALYQVVESRNHANGPEIRLKSPTQGLAAQTTVGFGSGIGVMITSGHSYWTIGSEWIRLAHRYRAWTDPSCGYCASWLNDKVAPTAVLQRLVSDEGESCSQEWTGIPQLLNCTDYYVSIGGYPGEQNTYLAPQADDVNVEICQAP